VDFDVAFFDDCVRRVNPDAHRMSVSATGGDGLPDFYDWLEARHANLAPFVPPETHP
jgi:Ni2+-binding GTPase involved in maturation of urease and hydrogenase